MSNLEADNSFLKKGAIVNVLGTVFKVFGPILTIMLARIFGTAEFGVFVSMQTLLLTIARTSTLGLDRGLHWYLPQNKLKGRPAFEGIMESFWITFVVSILVILVVCAGSFAGVFSKEIVFYIISLVFFSGTYIFSNSSEGNRKPWYAIFINDFLVAVLAPLVSIILYYAGVPHSLPLGLLFGQAGGFCIHAFLVKKQFPQMKIIPAKRISKELIVYSIPLGLTVLVGNILGRSTLWMVLFFLGPEAAGVYALMITISNGLQTIRNGFNPILTPVISGMDAERQKTDAKPVFSYCVSMATQIQIVIGFFIVLFPAEIMSIAGKAFVVQPSALGILLAFQLVATFFGMVNTVIDGIGKSVVNLYISIASLVVFLGFGFVLIPNLGLVGAALTTLIYGIFSAVCCNFYLYKRGLKLYSKKLFIDVVWMILLMLLYITLNVKHLQLEFLSKSIIYLVILIILGLQFRFYKRKF